MDYYKRTEQAPQIQTTTSTGTSAVAGPSTPVPTSATSVTAPALPHTAASTGPAGTVAPTPTMTATTLPVPVSGPPVTKKSDGQRDYKYAQEISQMVCYSQLSLLHWVHVLEC